MTAAQFLSIAIAKKREMVYYIKSVCKKQPIMMISNGLKTGRIYYP